MRSRDHESTADGGHGASDDHAPDDDHDHAPDDDHDHASDDDHDHDHHRHDVDTLGAAVVTVSSSRSLADDPSGDFIVQALVDAGHDVVTRELIHDDYDDIQHTVDTLVGRRDVDVVVSTGGTGVSPDDRTIEAIRPLFEKELPGFGQLFRRLSVDDIGTRAIATRATAGIADGVPVFCLPGSRAAVELGVEKLVVEEAPHLAGLASRGHEEDEEPSPATPNGRRRSTGRSDGGQNSGHEPGSDGDSGP
ncbi:MAG: MogA/MoaB family molybdenum cofactor biosynthesis protein [Halobacteriales archaeon]